MKKISCRALNCLMYNVLVFSSSCIINKKHKTLDLILTFVLQNSLLLFLIHLNLDFLSTHIPASNNDKYFYLENMKIEWFDQVSISQKLLYQFQSHFIWFKTYLKGIM